MDVDAQLENFDEDMRLFENMGMINDSCQNASIMLTDS